jgi:hypothetical protein
MKRFSIRTLLIVTAVVAVVLAFLSHRAVKQQRGRDWVASQNGHFMFSHKYDPITDEWDRKATLSAPDWLVDAFGIDYFDSVDSVILDNKEVDDLSRLADLQSLRSLAIYIEIDDKLSFAPLAELPKLRHLSLAYTNISAERLAKLRALLPHVRVEADNHPPEE